MMRCWLWRNTPSSGPLCPCHSQRGLCERWKRGVKLEASCQGLAAPPAELGAGIAGDAWPAQQTPVKGADEVHTFRKASGTRARRAAAQSALVEPAPYAQGRSKWSSAGRSAVHANDPVGEGVSVPKTGKRIWCIGEPKVGWWVVQGEAT
jgi:hypothetical protein